MKAFIALLILKVTVPAFAGTNEIITQSDLDAARSHYPPSKFLIATNTPAFEQYGFSLMLTEAERVRERCRLDISPLTVSNVYFTLKATAGGIEGGIATRDGRYHWGFSYNGLQGFGDANYFEQSFNTNITEILRLAKIKSKISFKEAENIARIFLHNLGLAETDLNLEEPPVVTQYKYEDRNDTTSFLPHFTIEWHDKDYPDEQFGVLTLEVSGITKKVCRYFNVSSHSPRFPIPANYYDMLGVKPPTNISQRLGFKPLERLPSSTNSAPK